MQFVWFIAKLTETWWCTFFIRIEIVFVMLIAAWSMANICIVVRAFFFHFHSLVRLSRYSRMWNTLRCCPSLQSVFLMPGAVLEHLLLLRVNWTGGISKRSDQGVTPWRMAFCSIRRRAIKFNVNPEGGFARLRNYKLSESILHSNCAIISDHYH